MLSSKGKTGAEVAKTILDKKGIFDVRDELRTMIKLEAINKAHQAANGFVYSLGHVVNHLKDNKKINKLMDLVTTYLEETDKIIIVYYYKEDLTTLYNSLTDYSVTTDINDFEHSAQILLLQYGQAEGLNLQYCNKMIFYTYDYSFLKFDQMCGRIYRSGQKNNVTYDVLINTDTIEDKIWWAIDNKKSTDDFLKGALKNNEELVRI